jgi:hypothetical protein
MRTHLWYAALILAALGVMGLATSEAHAQLPPPVVTYYSPVTTYYTPVTTYRPVTSYVPVTTYQPVTTYYAAPVTTSYAAPVTTYSVPVYAYPVRVRIRERVIIR